MLSNKKLAIDFDGTIVEDAYPSIGKPKIFAFETLKKLQSEGYRLILWTYRHGKSLEEAVEFCRKNGVCLICAKMQRKAEGEQMKYDENKAQWGKLAGTLGESLLTVDNPTMKDVVEGAFDSLFLDNCIATLDANLLAYQKYNLGIKNAIHIWDNEPYRDW